MKAVDAELPHKQAFDYIQEHPAYKWVLDINQGDMLYWRERNKIIKVHSIGYDVGWSCVLRVTIEGRLDMWYDIAGFDIPNRSKNKMRGESW